MGFFAAKKYKVLSEVSVNTELPIDITDKKLLKKTHWWYAIALVYLFFDYIRPQAFVPAIGLIRPSLVTIVILLGFTLTRGRRYLFESVQDIRPPLFQHAENSLNFIRIHLFIDFIVNRHCRCKSARSDTAHHRQGKYFVFGSCTNIDS